MYIFNLGKLEKDENCRFIMARLSLSHSRQKEVRTYFICKKRLINYKDLYMLFRIGLKGETSIV